MPRTKCIKDSVCRVHMIILWRFHIIPYKIGPFEEPIKTGLLDRFPTLRKDDSDVASHRPPLSPPHSTPTPNQKYQ